MNPVRVGCVGKALLSFFPLPFLPLFLCLEAEAKIHFPGFLAAEVQAHHPSWLPDSKMEACDVENWGRQMWRTGGSYSELSETAVVAALAVASKCPGVGVSCVSNNSRACSQVMSSLDQLCGRIWVLFLTNHPPHIKTLHLSKRFYECCVAFG